MPATLDPNHVGPQRLTLTHYIFPGNNHYVWHRMGTIYLLDPPQRSACLPPAEPPEVFGLSKAEMCSMCVTVVQPEYYQGQLSLPTQSTFARKGCGW